MAFNKKKLMSREEEERKIADLMPEYLELEMEIQPVRKQLQTAKLKRENLIGVVRFLRRKYRMLKKKSANSKASENGHMNQYVRNSSPMDQFETATVADIGKETSTLTKSGYAMAPTYEETTATTKFQYAMAPTYEEEIPNTQFQSAIVTPTYEKAVLQDANLLLNLYHNSKIGHLSATGYKTVSEPLRIINPPCVQSNKPLLKSNGLGTILKPPLWKNNSKEFVKPLAGKRKVSWEDTISLRL